MATSYREGEVSIATRSGFRVEDVTFHGARRQCEIENEIEQPEEVSSKTVKAPVSLTPEQVKSFYKEKIAEARDRNEKRVYSQTIVWVNELFKLRKRVVDLEEKLALKEEVESDSEDIV